MPAVDIVGRRVFVKVESVVWHPLTGWQGALATPAGPGSLGIIASDLPACQVEQALTELGDGWPRSVAIGCSTGGQSAGGVVHDGSIVATVVSFDRAGVVTASVEIEVAGGPRRAGRKLAAAVAEAGAKGALLVADCRAGSGLTVNGTLLAVGIDDVVRGLPLAGALAGDAGGSDATWVVTEHGGPPRAGWATIVGFTGDVELGFGSGNGWEAFGPERLVTRSHGEVLYELDAAPALPLYREYLGPHASALPHAARRIPLCVRDLEGNESVRTVVDVDEETQSLRFAGDVPQGAAAHLMCAPADSLVHHAQLAAKQASSGRESFAVAISGAGRRLSLGERIEDELEAVVATLAPATHLLGLHSCGELSSLGGHTQLGNETITLMTVGERMPVGEGASA